MMMLEGLAYMRFACLSVVALRLQFRLVRRLVEAARGRANRGPPAPVAKPKLGPAVNYDVALHLDFEDRAGLDAYRRLTMSTTRVGYTTRRSAVARSPRGWTGGTTVSRSSPEPDPAFGDVRLGRRGQTSPRAQVAARRGQGARARRRWSSR